MVDKKYESQDVHQALAHLVEELGEAVMAGAKTLRFGLQSYNPEAADREANVDWLLREMRDVDVAYKTFKAFLEASKNDDVTTWSHKPIQK